MFCERAENTAQAAKAGMGAKRPGPWGGFLPRASREGSSLLHSESVKRESFELSGCLRTGAARGKD